MADDTYEQLVAQATELAEKKDFAEAIRVLRQAVELDDGRPEAHYNLGVIYGLLAMSDFEVEEYFEDRVDEEMLFQNAVDEYQRAIDIDPTYVPAHNNLATIYAVHGERDLALQAVRRSLEINPHQPEARDLLDELQST